MTASSSKVGCRKSGAFFVPARPSKDPSPGRGVQAKPTFQAALVLTFRPGLLDGFIRISTSIPVSLANWSSFSSENFPSRPRARSDTRGCAILRSAPACTWLSPRFVRSRFTWRAISAFANASSGFGRPISANTLPLPSSTWILLGMFVYSSLSIKSTYSSRPEYRDILEPPANVADDLIRADLAPRGALQVANGRLRHLQAFKFLLRNRAGNGPHVVLNLPLG